MKRTVIVSVITSILTVMCLRAVEQQFAEATPAPKDARVDTLYADEVIADTVKVKYSLDLSSKTGSSSLTSGHLRLRSGDSYLDLRPDGLSTRNLSGFQPKAELKQTGLTFHITTHGLGYSAYLGTKADWTMNEGNVKAGRAGMVVQRSSDTRTGFIFATEEDPASLTPSSAITVFDSPKEFTLKLKELSKIRGAAPIKE